MSLGATAAVVRGADRGEGALRNFEAKSCLGFRVGHLFRTVVHQGLEF